MRYRRWLLWFALSNLVLMCALNIDICSALPVQPTVPWSGSRLELATSPSPTLEGTVCDVSRNDIIEDSNYRYMYATTEEPNCIYSYADFQLTHYGRFRSLISGGEGVYEGGIAIRRAGERLFTPVSTNYLKNKRDYRILAANTNSNDIVVRGVSPTYFGHNIFVLEDALNHLATNIDGSRSLDDNQMKAITVSSTDSRPIQVAGMAVSSNGRWYSFVTDYGLGRYDVINRRYDIVSVFSYYFTGFAFTADTGISENGTYVVTGGLNFPHNIVRVDPGCDPKTIQEVEAGARPGCNSLNFQPEFLMTMFNSNTQSSRIAVSEYENLIEFYDTEKYISARFDRAENSKLRYLALGDSFASGEGEELDGNYLAGTNIFGNYFRGIPREMCHLSNRSYPMLLGNSMQLSRGSDMRSVACSGAEVKDIWIPHLSAPYVDDTYLGQNTFTPVGTRPRLAPILFDQATKLKDAALNDYTPGRVRQVELVQKAKPAVMTVMIGGNDLNFGGTLRDCIIQSVDPINYLKTYNSDSKCSNINGNMKTAKANEVMSMYPKLLEFYKQLKIASPNTKTFVIGYPQFYTDNAQCAPHFVVGAVIQKDREAIRDLVDLANMTIHHAANDAGLTYIDISSALGSTAMCGDSSAVSDINAEVYRKLMLKIMKYADNPMLLNKELMAATSVSSVIKRYKSLLENSDMIEERVVDPMAVYYSMVQEMLHPNSKGHQLIFDRISKGLGADGLYSLACDEKIVLCPSGNVIGPVQGATISGSKIMSDEIEYHDESEKIDVAYQNSEDKLEHGILYKGKSATISVHEDSLGLSAPIDGSPAVTLHSTPTMLGTMTKSKDGFFELSTGAMKKEIEAGWHMLHITGNMTNGRSFDVYRSLFIRGPEGDYDDNGILDTELLCVGGVGCVGEDKTGSQPNESTDTELDDYVNLNGPGSVLRAEHLAVWPADDRGAAASEESAVNKSIFTSIQSTPTFVSNNKSSTDAEDSPPKELLVLAAGVFAFLVVVVLMRFVHR